MMLSVFCQFPFVHDRQKTDNIMAKGKLTKESKIKDKRETEKNKRNPGPREKGKKQTKSWLKGK
jgi:hypothetical protein